MELGFATQVDEVEGHECSLDIRCVEDEVLDAVYGNMYVSRPKRSLRAFRRTWLASKKHPFTQYVFKSTSALCREILRHSKISSSTIHPFSVFRRNWEIFMMFAHLMTLLFVPFIVVFLTAPNNTADDGITSWNFWDYIMIAIFIITLLDVYVNFSSGYIARKSKTIVLDKSRIARRYLLTYFFFDVISCIPYEFLLIVLLDLPVDEWHDMKYLNLLKFVRIGTLYSYSRVMFKCLNVSYVTTKVITTATLVFLFMHWLSCLYPLAITGGAYRRDLDTSEKVIPVWRRSITITVANVIGINMGIYPTMLYQVLTFICFSIIGLFIVIYIAVQVVMITRIVNFSTTRYEEMQRQLKEYIKFKQIPPPLERRMIDYSKFSFLKTCLREPLIFEFLSSRLKQEVLLHNCNRLIDQTPFFHGMPPPVIAKIVTLLTAEVVLANDVIIRVGAPGDSMYFISSGCVTVISITGREICHLSDGAHFGEIALVEGVAGDLRYASVVAIEPTELYRLTRANFLRVVAPHPELMQRVLETARTREGIIRILEDPEVLESMEAAEQFAEAGYSGRGRSTLQGFSFYQQLTPPAVDDSTDFKPLGLSSAGGQGAALPQPLPPAAKRLKRFVPNVPPSMSILAPKHNKQLFRPGELYRSAAGPSFLEQSLLSGEHVQSLRETSVEDLLRDSPSSASSSGLSKASRGGDTDATSKARTASPRPRRPRPPPPPPPAPTPTK